jgi:hypothetical protein
MKDFSTPYLRQKRKRLMQQLNQLDTLIMMRGSLIERYKKCGKPNCKCTIGKGHGPKYYLSVTLSKNNLAIIYVPIDLKSDVEQALLNYQKAKNIMEELSHVNRELLIRRQLL